MSDDGNSDGDGIGGSHGVILPECVQMFKEIREDNKRAREDNAYIRRALWGGEGTTGMVKDLNDIKQQNRMVTFLGVTIVGVVASVLTTFLIIFIGKL